MPRFLEQKLEAEAAKKGLTGKQADRYTFGAMNNMGAMHGSKVTPKGEAMQAKHNRDVKAGKAASGMAAPKHHGANLGKYLHQAKAK